MKGLILPIAIIGIFVSLFSFIGVSEGARTAASLFANTGTTVYLRNSADVFGDNTNPIANGQFTSLTIGTVTISSSTAGDLTVNATSTSTFLVQSDTNNVFRVDTTNASSTFFGTLNVTGAFRVSNASTTLISTSATTTLRMENDTGTLGSCIVAETPDGTTVYMVFTTTGVAVSTTSCE